MPEVRRPVNAMPGARLLQTNPPGCQREPVRGGGAPADGSFSSVIPIYRPGEFSPLAEFTRLREGRDRLLVRDGYEATIGALRDPRSYRAVDFASGGRESHPVVQIGDGIRVLVRAYRRGGALRRLNRDRYFLPGRAFRELRVTEHAARSGVRVPTIVGAAERWRILGYHAAIASLWIEGARDLVEWLRNAPEADGLAALHEAGSQVAAMHDAGVAHPDLNLRNVLVVSGNARPGLDVYLIDFDRARIHAAALPAAVRRRNLLRFGRSARKRGVPLGPREWAAMREGYGAAWPLSAALG